MIMEYVADFILLATLGVVFLTVKGLLPEVSRCQEKIQ